MSEPAAPTPAPAPAPAPPAPAPAAPVQAPEGFVSQADLDRVETQRKGFQSENERLKAEIARLASAAPATPAPASGEASEIAALRADIAKANQLMLNQASVPGLKTEFPHADPRLLSAESVSSFASPEALRLAVEADHNRVAKIVAAAEQAKEDAIKAASAGQSPLGPVAPPTPGADPTVEQLNAMSPTALDEYQAANPGVVERVMAAAMAAG